MPASIQGAAVPLEAIFEKLKESPNIIALRRDERLLPVGFNDNSMSSRFEDAVNLF